jgi:hypothetical protein
MSKAKDVEPVCMLVLCPSGRKRQGLFVKDCVLFLLPLLPSSQIQAAVRAAGQGPYTRNEANSHELILIGYIAGSHRNSWEKQKENNQFFSFDFIIIIFGFINLFGLAYIR